MSEAISEIADQNRAVFEHARVQAVTTGGLVVQAAGCIRTATTAAGCLLQPASGDLVLLSRQGHNCFVVTVLEQASAQGRIRYPGTLTIDANDLELHGHERVRIVSDDQMHTTAAAMDFTSNATTLRSRHLSLTADEGTARIDKARFIAGLTEVFSKRIFQCARQVVRRVEDVETLHVGQLVQHVRKGLTTRAHRISLTSRKDMQVKGERIHMG